MCTTGTPSIGSTVAERARRRSTPPCRRAARRHRGTPAGTRCRTGGDRQSRARSTSGDRDRAASTVFDHTRWWSSSSSKANRGPRSNGASLGCRQRVGCSKSASSSITRRSRSFAASPEPVAASAGAASVAGVIRMRSAARHGAGTASPGGTSSVPAECVGPGLCRGDTARERRAGAGDARRRGRRAGTARSPGTAVNHRVARTPRRRSPTSARSASTSGRPPSFQHCRICAGESCSPPQYAHEIAIALTIATRGRSHTCSVAGTTPRPCTLWTDAGTRPIDPRAPR